MEEKFLSGIMDSDNDFEVQTDEALFKVFQIKETNMKYILVGELRNTYSHDFLLMSTGIVGVVYENAFYFNDYRQAYLIKFYDMIDSLAEKHKNIYSLTNEKNEFCHRLAEESVPEILDDYIKQTSYTATLTEQDKDYCKECARESLLYYNFIPYQFSLKEQTEEAITNGDYLDYLQGFVNETDLCLRKIIEDDYNRKFFLRAYVLRKYYDELMNNPLSVVEDWELKISKALSDKFHDDILVGFEFCGKESELKISVEDFSTILSSNKPQYLCSFFDMDEDFKELGRNLNMSDADYISLKENLTYIKHNGKIIYTKE